ncbi:MAG: right-handed parallel beta-helix repeat-containing protein, partial [Phycisphaerales bacterium]
YFHSDEGRDSVVEGFTITNGVACTGAAMMCTEGASPTIRNNILRGNIAEYDCDGGGGIACRRNAAPLIEGNLIEGNLSMAGQGGGGIHCYEAGDVEIVGNIIAGNTAESPGGGIDIVDDGGLVLIANNLIAGNTSSRGGAISCRGAGRAMVVNNTVVGNRATERYALLGRTGGIDIDTGLVANCILWGNIDDKGFGEPAQIRAAPHDVEVNYNCIRGWTGTLGGIGNMGENPAFAVPGYWNHNQTPAEPNDDFWIMGDHHLKSQAGRWDPAAARWVLDTLTSPCIDAGDPLASIGYEVFPNGGIVNIGAYGATAEAAKSYFGRPPCKKILAGDINGDCKVNFGDFCIMALHWLEDTNP